MTKAVFLASAVLIGCAAFDPSVPSAAAAEAKKDAHAVKKERCERNAMLHLYKGAQKDRYIQECLARKDEEPKGKAAAPGGGAPGRAVVPKVTPLGAGNPPSTSTGSATPSNAPVAPSAPVTGSAGTSTTGSSATSVSGSSGSSIGSSGGR
jgi:hypothetical protein